jgi:chlorobactene glucosyltransferase
VTNPFANDQVLHLIVFQAVMLVILLDNIRITRRVRRHSLPREFPLVSVLVPARNEERNIGGCVESLLAQDYPCFEVIVFDDQSSDGTRGILEKLAAAYPELQLLYGTPPDGDVVGKNWACSQLARQARGELLLFTDADTRHRRDMLISVVAALLEEKADLLTGFPRQEVCSWGERLLVPFFSWVLLNFVPLAIAYRFNLSILSGAVGQFMLFRREAYLAIGGHESVSASVVEDMSLVRRIQSTRLRWRVAHVADLISCRMYQSSREAVDGFTKNLFAVFGYRLIPFLFAFLWLLAMFWEPWFVLALGISGKGYLSPLVSIAGCLALAVLVWLIPYIDLGVPFGLAFLYPFTILANVLVAFRSLIYHLGGKVRWKDRPLARANWKWL